MSIIAAVLIVALLLKRQSWPLSVLFAKASVTCARRYGEDHEPKEPKEGDDDGGAWDDDEALHHMLGGGAEGGEGGTNMQTLD